MVIKLNHLWEKVLCVRGQERISYHKLTLDSLNKKVKDKLIPPTSFPQIKQISNGGIIDYKLLLPELMETQKQKLLEQRQRGVQEWAGSTVKEWSMLGLG